MRPVNRAGDAYATMAHGILSALPADHPARIAYATGAREASDSISLTWLVADRPGPCCRAGRGEHGRVGRTLARQGGYFRP
jgi:hypothetical protein